MSTPAGAFVVIVEPDPRDAHAIRIRIEPNEKLRERLITEVERFRFIANTERNRLAIEAEIAQVIEAPEHFL